MSSIICGMLPLASFTPTMLRCSASLSMVAFGMFWPVRPGML